MTAVSRVRRRASPRSPANSIDPLPDLGGGGWLLLSRGRSPLPFLASLAAATAASSPRGGSPARCLRSVPRSGARTAAALDFGRINFEVWEPCGSHGSSSYSPPPPPPPPVRRCRGCRRGCPSPAARSAPRRCRASLSARTFPTAAFLPGPHFFFFFF